MTEEIGKIGAEDANAQARAWLVRLHSGAATELDVLNLRAWRARDARNEDAFRQATRLWSGMGRALGADAATAAAPRARAPAVSRRQALAWVGGGVAAVAAVVVARNVLPEGELLTTRKGERRAFALADGARIELNTDSRVLVRTLEGQSVIRVLRGEMLLQIAYRVGRSLLVEAERTSIRAQAARFLTRVAEDGVRVLCLTGAVEVSDAHAAHALTEGMSASAQSGGELIVARQAEPDLALSWRSGVLVVRGWTLRQVVVELNRYREGRVILADDAAGDLRVNGSFRIDHIDGAVDEIAEALGLRVTRLPGGLVLLG